MLNTAAGFGVAQDCRLTTANGGEPVDPIPVSFGLPDGKLPVWCADTDKKPHGQAKFQQPQNSVARSWRLILPLTHVTAKFSACEQQEPAKF